MDTTPIARPRSIPVADTVCGAVVFMTTNLPPLAGRAIKVAAGMVSCPALDGA